MKLFMPSMLLSAACTNAWIAREEIPCASGVLRESAALAADGVVIGAGAPCARAIDATAVRRTSETATRRAFIWRVVEEMTSMECARSGRVQLHPLLRQRLHRLDPVADAQQRRARSGKCRPRRHSGTIRI